MKGTEEKISDNTYKISEHIAIAIGYSCQSTDEFPFSGNRKSYFGSNSIKDYAKDLLEIETRYSVNLKKTMIFTEKDKHYHKTTNTCHMTSKTRINKVRDHSHQTSSFRVPACNICNLNYRQQIFIPVIYHNDIPRL